MVYVGLGEWAWCRIGFSEKCGLVGVKNRKWFCVLYIKGSGLVEIVI